MLAAEALAVDLSGSLAHPGLRFAPSGLHASFNLRSPDGAQRNPGQTRSILAAEALAVDLSGSIAHPGLRFAPSGLHASFNLRSPDGAQRNPGQTAAYSPPRLLLSICRDRSHIPDYASLYPGYTPHSTRLRSPRRPAHLRLLGRRRGR